MKESEKVIKKVVVQRERLGRISMRKLCTSIKIQLKNVR